jgi:hypothetical protein
LGLELEGTLDRDLPVGLGARRMPLYRKVARTAYGYPRAWPDIKKRPLGP